MLLIASLGSYLTFAAIDRVLVLSSLQMDRIQGTSEQGEFEDYIAFYAAGRLVLEGRGESLYDTDVVADTEHEIMGREVGGTGSLGYFNPPFVAVMFAPLALLPVGIASLVLLLVNVLLVIVAAVIIHRLLNLHGLVPSVLFGLALASFHSVFWLIGHGQFSMLLVLGFLGFYDLQKRGKQRLSGFALALLLVKPQMAILPVLVLVARKQWSPLVSFAAVAGVLTLVSIAVSGPSVLWEYPRYTLGSTGWEGELGIDIETMYGWNGLLAKYVDNHSATHLALTSVAGLLTVGLVVNAFRTIRQTSSGTFALAVAVMIAGSILVNPHVYMQDLVLVGLVVVLGYIGWRETPLPAIPWLGIGALVWLSQLVADRTRAEFDLNTQTPLLCVLFFLMVWGIAKSRPSTSAALAPADKPAANLAA